MATVYHGAPCEIESAHELRALPSSYEVVRKFVVIPCLAVFRDQAHCANDDAIPIRIFNFKLSLLKQFADLRDRFEGSEISVRFVKLMKEGAVSVFDTEGAIFLENFNRDARKIKGANRASVEFIHLIFSFVVFL